MYHTCKIEDRVHLENANVKLVGNYTKDEMYSGGEYPICCDLVHIPGGTSLPPSGEYLCTVYLHYNCAVCILRLLQCINWWNNFFLELLFGCVFFNVKLEQKNIRKHSKCCVNRIEQYWNGIYIFRPDNKLQTTDMMLRMSPLLKNICSWVVVINVPQP